MLLTAHGLHPDGPDTVANAELFFVGRRPVMVVTERGDNPGLSITNNAEKVLAAVRAVYADALLVEHYDANSYIDGRPQRWPETYDLVDVDERGEATWKYLGDNLTDALAAL